MVDHEEKYYLRRVRIGDEAQLMKGVEEDFGLSQLELWVDRQV